MEPVVVKLNAVEFQSLIAGTALGPRRRRFPMAKTATYPLLRGFHVQPRVPRGVIGTFNQATGLRKEVATKLRDAEEAVFIRGGDAP